MSIPSLQQPHLSTRGHLAVALSSPEFHAIELSDRSWILPILAAENSLSTNDCFGTLYLWGEAFGMTVARSGNRLLTHFQTADQSFFGYPSGSGSLSAAIGVMREKAAASNVPLVINGVTAAQKDELNQALPGYFAFSETRESADYVYEAEVLSSLAGKKMQGKRNHCNRFERDWRNWRFEPLQRTHFPDCVALLTHWEKAHANPLDEMQSAEHLALARAFSSYEALELEGGALFIGETLVAFTIGEPVGANGFDIHFEKALADINGAYQMINREFVRSLLARHPHIRYINREEDMGQENLRKAKESYHPALLLDKYTARCVADMI